MKRIYQDNVSKELSYSSSKSQWDFIDGDGIRWSKPKTPMNYYIIADDNLLEGL